MTVKLAYFFMSPHEPFLVQEVKALVQAGFKIQAFYLRGTYSRQQVKLATELGSPEVQIYYSAYLLSWGLWLDFYYWTARKPRVLWHLLWQLAKSCWTRPRMLLQSLLLIPKSFRIARIVESTQTDIVHMAWGHYPSVTGYLIKCLIPQVHTTLAIGAYDRLSRHPLTVLMANKADVVFTQSNASADLIRNEWPQTKTPVVVIRRGIDLEEIEASSLSSKIPGLIVSAGRLIEVKGHQYIIRAFADIHKELPYTRLLILGEGNYRHQLEQLVDDLRLNQFVEILGHVSQKDLYMRMSQASLFVLASKSKADNLPNTVKEAMALGVPVVTTPTLGIEELIQNEITGLIVPMEDVDKIKHSCVKLLLDDKFAGRIRENALCLVRTGYDLLKTTKERQEVYRRIIQNGQSETEWYI